MANLCQRGGGGHQRTTGTIPPDEPFCCQQKQTWWALLLWSNQPVPVSFATDRRGSFQTKAAAYHP